MTYTRQAFREWLETLPADEPFCAPADQCPVSAFGVARGFIESSEWQVGEAMVLDKELINSIDENIAYQDADEVRHWDKITPREVLQIITDLEAA